MRKLLQTSPKSLFLLSMMGVFIQIPAHSLAQENTGDPSGCSNQETSGTIFCDEDIQDNNTIIVTGTRFATPIEQVGRSVSIVTLEDIQQRQQRFLFDTLTNVPGVQAIRSGSFGGLTSVSIRGLPSDQTLLVQDGIVSNNPAFFGNSFDFANFDSNDIERVEILRGAQSTLFGSDAIGGVINIITKDGRDGFGADAFVEGGSFGTFRGGATLVGGNELLSGRVSVSGITSSGFSSADEADGNTEDDGFRNITLSSKIRAQLNENLSLQGVIRYSDSHNEFDGFPPPTFALGDTDATGDTRDLSLGGYINYVALEGKIENRFSVSYYDSAIINEEGGFVTFDPDGSRLSYEYLGTLRPFENLTLIAGFEFERERSSSSFTPPEGLDNSTTSGFGLAQWQPVEYATLEGGFRIDNTSSFGSETTFSGSASVRVPNTGLTLRGSYSEGFQAPTAGELDFNLAQTATFTFDPDIDLFLTPETSSGWDVGFDYVFLSDRIEFQATYFDQQVDDLVTFLFVAGSPNFGAFINIEEFDTRGVEIGTRIRLSNSLDLSASYTYVDALNITTNTTAGGQPENRFSAELAYQPIEKLTLSAGVIFNGQETVSFQTLDSFTLLNLRAAYQISDHLEVFARVENATDADYQDNVGFGTAPASVFGGIRVNY